MIKPVLSDAMYVMFMVFFTYFIAMTAFYTFLAFIGLGEAIRKTRQNEEENYPLVYLSTVVIPVSIVVPARNEEEWITDTIYSILKLNYPKYELIIVDDGSTDRTMEILNGILDLKSLDKAYIKHYKDGKVNEILQSEKYPHVTVIQKQPGTKKAGAVNAGLNIARYDYVCTMDADTVLEPDALLKVMAHVERDPEKIIGVGSYYSLANGIKISKGRVIDSTPSHKPIIAYQNLEYIRSFIGNRIAWSRYNAMPNIGGGYGVWRKDILYELGGYSIDFTCEDIEFTFRAHDYAVAHKEKGYRILMLPYHAGWTEGPGKAWSLISQRERWQRVTNETIWRYKYMFCNPRYGRFAFLTFPYFLFYEVLGVFFELASIGMVTAGWIAGLLDVNTFLAFFMLMILSQSAISLVSILAFTQNQRLFRPSYIFYLVALNFAEFFWYRWLLSVAKVIGTYKSLIGVRTYNQYQRMKR